MTLSQFDNPQDRDFLDENKEISKYIWKEYWDSRQKNPETRWEVRKDKAATKRRIHKKGRRDIKKDLKIIGYKFSK